MIALIALRSSQAEPMFEAMRRSSESITVRGLEPGTKQRLRLLAAAQGHSMEEEVRRILLKATNENRAQRLNLAEEIASIVDPLGGFELDLPQRAPTREPPSFGDWTDDPG
jgi:plasmid stability protein